MILLLIAWILLLPLSILNWFFVDNKNGYFKSTAINIDKFANSEFRSMWNKTLRTEKGYHFGDGRETLSSALGKNERDNTLSNTGEALVYMLNKIDENHCIKSINNF
jgi:hypothetical protein